MNIIQGTMIETLNPMQCPVCNSRNTGVTANGYNCRYYVRCSKCRCRWKVFNRKTRFSPIEIIGCDE